MWFLTNVWGMGITHWGVVSVVLKDGDYLKMYESALGSMGLYGHCRWEEYNFGYGMRHCGNTWGRMLNWWSKW